MAENQGQTIAAPVNHHPAPPEHEAQATTPMWSPPQAGPAPVGQTQVGPPGPQTAYPQLPPTGPSGQIQPHPYGGPSTPPPMTFEVPQEQLASAPPAAGGHRGANFVEKLKTPVAATVIGGVLLLGVGFATGYVVGHDRGASSVSNSTGTGGQTGGGFGGGGFGGGGFGGGFGGQTGQGQTGQGQTGQGQTGTGQGGTGTSPFGQSQDGSQQFGGSSSQGGTDGSTGTGTGTGTGSATTTDGSTTDLSQTQ